MVTLRIHLYIRHFNADIWIFGSEYLLKQANFLFGKYYRRAIQLLASQFYRNPDQDLGRSMLVAGTARSGTVWLADMIASQISCRTLFEPFNPDLVPEYREFHYFQYMRPGSENKKLHAFAQSVFSGQIRNSWVDHQNERVFPKYRLVKEIRANLMLRWLHDNFPAVPIIFIMRHPCAVVLSRMQLGWATDRDIDPFLSQPELVTDQLAPHLDTIRHARTEEEKHAVIWSVTNLVPLKQFQSDGFKIVFYEDLCTQPEVELTSVFKVLGKAYPKTDIGRITGRPSQTTRKNSAILIGTDKVGSWKKSLEVSQIDNILRIVDAFGLSHLYGDSPLPLNRSVL